MKLTKKEAKRLSILKWEFIIANGGRYQFRELPEELRLLTAECGYCEKYWGSHCDVCPVYITGIGCCTGDKHPWSIWHENRTVKNAQAMLDLILRT